MDTSITTLAPDEAIEAVNALETVEEVREVAKAYEVAFSGNTGVDTLKAKVVAHIETLRVNENDDPLGLNDDDEEIQIAEMPKSKIPPVAELLTMDAKWIEDKDIRRAAIRAQALKLVRVRITNLDPSEAELSGGIITAGNKYLGKVSKYIPYGEESENGYHIPQILLNQLKNQKFVLRRKVKGSKLGIPKYTTSFVNKFSIEVLEALSKEDMKDLAATQRASGTV